VNKKTGLLIGLVVLVVLAMAAVALAQRKQDAASAIDKATEQPVAPEPRSNMAPTSDAPIPPVPAGAGTPASSGE